MSCPRCKRDNCPTLIVLPHNGDDPHYGPRATEDWHDCAKAAGGRADSAEALAPVWHPASELPNDCRTVWAFQHGSTVAAYVSGADWRNTSGVRMPNVTHWCELPAPPKDSP